MSGTERHADTGTVGRQLHYPDSSAPGFADRVGACVARSIQLAAGVSDLVNACQVRDMTLSLKVAADLAMNRLLVGFYLQQDFVSMLLELEKNGFLVWSASV